MSTDDEQRVRNSHYNRITCNGPGCPGGVQHVDSVDARSGRHTAGNRAARQAIPGAADARWRSALTDPAERRLGPGGNRSRRRLMLAVTPGATRAVLVMALATRYADHGPNGRRLSCSRALDAQAALARRMRRRRSAERSSSFSPPHVPYFSGLDTA